jgi:ElaB/YqjD/DUF883 family membrane-anchored ribosome-binding protein
MESSSEKTPYLPKDAEELIANISQLMAEAEEMLNESTSYHAEEKVALLRSHRNGKAENLIDKYLALKSRITSVAQQTDETIRACPYEAVAVALGIGVLLGATFGRRRS